MIKMLSRWLFVSLCAAPLCLMAAGGNGDAKLSKKSIQARDGLKLVCDVGGRGDVALIFLHGWCGDREYWKNQAEVFARDYRIVALDQAGHGESGKERKQWTVASLAEDVEAVVNTLDLKRVILIGHSMGGPVGLAAAKRMPGKVVAVVGVDTMQNVESKMRQDQVKQIMDNFLTDFQGTMATMFAGLLPEQADRDLKNWLTSRAAAQDQKMALGLMRDMTELDVKTLLAEVKVPVRCINSSGGYQFFAPTAVEANSKYADYNAVFIESVGHYPMLEKPSEFNRRLQEILKEVAGRK